MERMVDRCNEQGFDRVFVVADAGVRSAGLLAPTLDRLTSAGILCGVYDAIAPEPALEQVDHLAEEIRASKAIAVIGLGGGSVMDATKVACILAVHPGRARDYLGIGKVPSRGLPSILVPTTSGTGSEATFVAILTDKVTGNKAGVVSPHLLADLAVVDPSLTDRLPRQLTASTGMDALVHALEAYIAKVSTPLARGLAVQAAGCLGWALEAAVNHPNDTHARDAMSLGSHLAGMAFANSSCCAVHALALPLGGRYPIPHGVITGAFFGEVMRRNAVHCESDFQVFCDALGWGQLKPDSFCDRLDALADSVGLFEQLRQVSVDVGSIGAMARDACLNRRLMDPNPIDFSESEVVSVYRKVLGSYGTLVG